MQRTTSLRRATIWLATIGYALVVSGLPLPLGGMQPANPQSAAAKRLAEAKEAARILGATFHAPICDDLELTYDVGLLRKVAAVVREAKADIVLTHSPQDYMEDHMAASRLAVTAAFASANVRNSSCCPERRMTT
jgi:LmbE family N-acetylglucosaminyl deacetylase